MKHQRLKTVSKEITVTEWFIWSQDLREPLLVPPLTTLHWPGKAFACSTETKGSRAYLFLQVTHVAQVQADSFNEGYEDDDSDHNEFVVVRQERILKTKTKKLCL